MANSRSNEEWRDIPNYEGYYQASSLGRIRRVEGILCDGRRWKARVLKQHSRHGVRAEGKADALTNLCVDGKNYKGVLVARLVCAAFHGAPADGLTVDHVDNDPSNNRADNLEWVTRSENIHRGWVTGCFASKYKRRCNT